MSAHNAGPGRAERMVALAAAHGETVRCLFAIELSKQSWISRLRPRHVATERGQAYEPEVPVKVRKWISPALASPDVGSVSTLEQAVAAVRQNRLCPA
jgi:hypothetical protein